MTDSDLSILKLEVVAQVPKWHSVALGYGWASAALSAAFGSTIAEVPVAAALAALIVLAVTHWQFREQYGNVPALSKVDAFDITPGAALRALENDPECHAMGVRITRGDWPKIFKAGLKTGLRASVETFHVKALNITGYAFLAWVTLNKLAS